MTNSPSEKNSRFSVQLLEKIGAPLLSVIENVAPEISDEAGQVAQAEIMAQLLGQCVAMGAMLYNTLEIKESEEKADTTRVALTSLVSPFIAEFYLKRKKVPTEDNIKRMLKSLEAVLMFGENFKPASDHKSRLQTIDHKAVFFDESQPVLVTMQSMVTVVNAVEEFSFGQNRRKLVQEIASRLELKSQEIAKTQEHQDKLTELMIFKGLADVYADCHRSETRRVLTDESARDNLSVAPIWEKFEVRVKMIEALMGIEGHVDMSASAAGGGIAPVVATVAEGAPAPVAPPVEQAQPQTPVAPPPVAQTAPPEQPAATAGPMGFFKKGDEAPAQPAPVEQPVATEAVQAPPAEAPPVASAPPAEVPAETTEAPPSGSSSSGPMGFFKKPTEEE